MSHRVSLSVPTSRRDRRRFSPLATQRDAWDAGDRLSRWHGDDLEIVRVVEAEEHDPFHGYLVVKRRSSAGDPPWAKASSGSSPQSYVTKQTFGEPE